MPSHRMEVVTDAAPAIEAGACGASSLATLPRVVRLTDLDDDARRLVLALVALAKARRDREAKAARAA